MTVSREALESRIEAVRAEVGEQRAGVYGADSFAWEVNREAGIFLGGGRAAMLQLAHPFVAQAIQDHSRVQADLLGRFQRTFAHVHAMVFGDLDAAVDSARRVHQIHERITGDLEESVGCFPAGTRYEANDEQALLWVHATLIDSAVMTFEKLVRPLSLAEKDRYWSESRQFARLFGIPEKLLPAGWHQFAAYFQDTLASDVISVGRAGRKLCQLLLTPPAPYLTPIFGWLRLVTAQLLPERLRLEFDLPNSPRARWVAERSLSMLGQAYPRLPGRLRHVPAYVEATRRVRGEPAVDVTGRAVEKWVLNRLSGV